VEMRDALDNKRNVPAVTEKVMDSRMSKRNLRAGKTALAGAGGLLAAEATRRYIKPQVSSEVQPYVDMAANAEQGFGGVASVAALKNFAGDAFGKSPVPADTETEIRSRAAEARGDPHTISGKGKAAPPAGPDPARMAELRAKRAADLRTEAKAAGLHVSGTKEDLARRIAKSGQQPATAKPKGRLPRGKSGLLLPLAAGAVAYDAASSDAEASGVDPENARRRGVAAGRVQMSHRCRMFSPERRAR
jgi:hypothetical protein